MSLTRTQSAESENADTVLGTRLTRPSSFPNGTTLALQSNISQSCLWANFAGTEKERPLSHKQPTQTRQATPPSLPDAVTFQHLITAANDENLVVPCQRIWVRHGLSRNEG